FCVTLKTKFWQHWQDCWRRWRTILYLYLVFCFAILDVMKRKSGRKSKSQDEEESNGIDNGADSELEDTPKKRKSASPRKAVKDDASSAESINSDAENETKRSKRSRKSAQKKESNNTKDHDNDEEQQNEV
ncbi:unnamed protein product, partial [Callosobruchus maculatus]